MTLEQRIDGFINAMTGIGDGLRDKAVQAIFSRGRGLADDELEALFQEDWLAARIVEQPAEEALRQGFTITAKVDDDSAGSPEIATNIHDALAKLHTIDAIEDGVVWGALFGRGHVLMGVNDGQRFDRPLDLNKARSLDYLSAYDARDLSPHTYYEDDPLSAKFGEPEVYRLQHSGGRSASTSYVHESRLLTFRGVRSTPRYRVQNNWRDPSVLRRCVDTIRGYGTAWQAVEIMLQAASQGIYKIQDLIKMTSIPGGEDALKTRMRLIDMARSVARSLVIDAERESFELAATSFAGIPEVLDKFMLRLAGAANRPVTVLFGQAPAGLNATGESDVLLWNNQVQAQQLALKPQLERLVEVLCSTKNGPTNGAVPERFEIVFPPLRTPTAKERQEIKKIQADIDAIYIDKEVVSPEEVAMSRFRPEGWSDEMNVDLDLREQIQTSDAQRLLEEGGASEPSPARPEDGGPGQADDSDGVEEEPAEAA